MGTEDEEPIVPKPKPKAKKKVTKKEEDADETAEPTGGPKLNKRPAVSVAIAKRKLKEKFDEEQEAMLKKAIEAKLTEEEILEFYHAKNSAEKMEQYIRDHERSADVSKKG